MKKIKEIALDTLCILAGSIIFSVGLNGFSLPSNLLLGGATGVATILHHFFGISVGLSVLLFNIPLFVLCYRDMGRKYMMRTLYATVLFSVSLDVVGIWFPWVYRGDTLLAALFGGLIMGVGLSVVYSRGFVTGGTDLMAVFLTKRFPIFSFSRWILWIDGGIILLGALLFHSIDIGLYSALMVFIYSAVLEQYFSGKSRGKVALILSDKAEEVRGEIYKLLGRGVTFLPAVGGMKGKSGQMLMCAVSDAQANTVRSLLAEIDPSAFVAVLRATEIWGEGFLKL